MKNIVTIVLSLVLAAAIIFGLVLYGKYADTKDALLISEEKMSELNEKVIQFDQETSALHDQIEKDAEYLSELKKTKVRVEELENATSLKDKALSEFEEKLQNLEKQFKEGKIAKEALRAELSAKDDLTKGLQVQLSDLEGEKALAETKMSQLKGLYDTKLTELANAKRCISELDATINVKNQDLLSFEERLRDLGNQLEGEKKAKAGLETELSYRDATTAELQEKLKSSQARILYLEGEIAKGKGEIEDIQRQLSDLETEKAIAASKMDQLKSSHDVKSMELKSAKERISELENTISVKNQRLSSLEEELNNLEKQLEEGKKAKAALQTELAYRDAVTSKLQEKLEESQSRIMFLEDVINKSKSEIEGLQYQLSELRGDNALALTKIDQLKSSYDVKSMELKSANERISELENTISVKNQRLSSFEEELNSLEKQLDEAKNTKMALEAELSYRDAATAELQEKLKSSRSRILYLEGEIAKGKNEIKRLQLQLSNIEGEKANDEIKIAQLKTTYEKLVSDLQKQIENQEVTIKTFEEKISVTFVDRILFEFGKAKISPQGRKILGKIGNTLKNVRGKQIRVVGHTDDVPISPGYHYKFPSNWELSAARAASVVNYLQNEQGLDPANLEAVGRSFYEPIASNETAKGRAQNRRVNIIIVPKGE